MKKLITTLFTCVTILLCCSRSFAQVKLKTAMVYFVTPAGTDDKDWDTKVTVSLYLSNGTLIGSTAEAYNNATAATPDNILQTSFCCVPPIRDQNGNVTNAKTMFVDDSRQRGPFVINIARPVNRQDLKTGYITVSMMQQGHDRWIFIPALVLNFDDGTSPIPAIYQRNTVIEQDAPMATLTFQLPG